MPTACAPIVGRDCSRVRIAYLNPSPSSPRRFSTGTSQSVKCSATVGDPWMPSFFSSFPTLNPFMPGSTRSAVTPLARLARAVDTNTVMTPAWEPLVTHIFEPFTT
jgi:hypothetical protein